MVESKYLSDYQFRLFFWKYIKEFVSVPKEPLTRTQFISLLFSRLLEIALIGFAWMFSKIPLVGTRMERVFAQKLSHRWKFKAMPMLEALSDEAKKYKAEKTIEINDKIDVQTKILDISTFNEVIERFPLSSISECGCRSVIMHCDSPYHTCLTMRWPQEMSDKIPDASRFKEATREELERVLKLCDKHALVHMVLTFPDEKHPYTVCSCCDCCCFSFREFKAHAIPMIVGSKYVARIDPEKCTGCYRCINYRCRFRAILKVNEDGTVIDPRGEDKELFKLKWPFWSENRRGWGTRIRKDPPSWKKKISQHKGKWFAKVDPNRCFGCGNCSSPKYGCPKGAIKLYPRKN